MSGEVKTGEIEAKRGVRAEARAQADVVGCVEVLVFIDNGIGLGGALAKG